ncbi:alcohol dehydrogenase catalytic domain-containing protein [Harryflintia acetispora]|uniref:alcohol dehydrogenase catalytic domain-containing protein n=1 Tax=Harryflintia acetispora TaxID=1849041 RepID=UPI0018999592|nr:alcohol dehydrogenase catalytic domain-containing protein [Harryflintia acetispora]
MKALIAKEAALTLEEREAPRLTSGEILVRVSACGLSREDLPGLLQAQGKIIGREITGIVKEAADARFEAFVGKRVVLIPYRTCEGCLYCRTNRKPLCESLVWQGYADTQGKQALDGGAAEWIKVWGAQALPVDDGLSDAQLGCVPVYAAALAAARKSEYLYAEHTAVLGSGALGLALAEVLRSMGSAAVLYIDEDKSRTEMAQSLGARCAKVLPEDGRVGYRTVFDTVCTASSQRTALELTREKGSVINCACGKEEVPYLLRDLNGERSICSVGGPQEKDYYDALRMLAAGRLSASFAGRAYSLADFDEAIKDLCHGAPRAVVMP